MPKTRYTPSGDVSIAYQVFGDGPKDLVYVPGFVSNVEVVWEEPHAKRFLDRLASFARVIMFDKRGTGLSDPVGINDLPTLEERMDDVRAVMDAVSCEHATLLGHSEGGAMCVLFAATYPERTDGLILNASYASRIYSPEYPWAPTVEVREAEIAELEGNWGDPETFRWLAPSLWNEPGFQDWIGRYIRFSASPRAAGALIRMNTQMDMRAVLPTIQVPTLCLYKTHDQDVNIEEGRWIADQIPGAMFVELPGGDHYLPGQGATETLDAIEEFMTGHRSVLPTERTLATVLFTDIVGSTAHAARIGDRAWTDLIGQHDSIATSEIARFRGRLVKTTGDGLVATFDGPGRAVSAAKALQDRFGELGLTIRAGVHTGEIQSAEHDIHGMGVVITARIMDKAADGEIWTSPTVPALVVGSGLEFEPRGEFGLKGVPGSWALSAVR